MNLTQIKKVGDVVKYTTQLPAPLIKWVKRQALEQDVPDYQIICEALEEYKTRIEENTPSHHWLLQ